MTDKDFEVDIDLDEDDLNGEEDLSGYDDDDDEDDEDDALFDEEPIPEGEEEGFWKRNINKRLEGIVPDIVKKALVGSMGSLFMSEDGLRQTLSDLRLPKEAVTFILNQADNTKREFLRLIAREMRDFLESTNFYEEIQKILTSLSFEIRTEIRLIPNDSAVGVKPNVRNRVRVKRRGRDESEHLYDSDEEEEEGEEATSEDEERSEDEDAPEEEGFFAKMKKERERKGREKKERRERERKEREEREDREKHEEE